jgi:hypothetical protein
LYVGCVLNAEYKNADEAATSSGVTSKHILDIRHVCQLIVFNLSAEVRCPTNGDHPA